ncbi:calcium-binding protein [Bradyrhizobium sp. UBA2491]|uniref:calcium-binding protein n=1 Tax=Bradyrhizobium sp. UBA2491 TaxID=1946119 RepID=UPI0025BCA977|nr:calcium-binding protein [Bradyrhizobium sp. UBA2491]
MEQGAAISNPDPDANALIEINANNTVHIASNLKAIVEATNRDVTLSVIGSGSVLVATGAGNDYVSFVSSRDADFIGETTVFAGAGNDTLYGSASAAANTMDGGDGNDLLVGSSGTVAEYGGSGNDILYSNARDLLGVVLEGGAGDDTLVGGVIGGSETLHGDAGNDLLVGADETASEYGGSDNDVLYSGSAAGHGSFLSGDDGNDSLYAGAGNDLLVGGAGNDLLVGGAGSDSLYGGAGDDVLYSGSNSFHGTLLDGGDGNDVLYGSSLSGGPGHYSDTLQGGAGNDTLIGGTGTNFEHGGSGNDVLYAGSDALRATVLFGDDGNDVLYGSARNDTLYGGAGNDTLVAGSGHQWLIADGNDGSSFIGSVTGTASMVGGYGQDYFYLSNPHSSDTIDGRGGDKDSLTFLDHASTDLTAISDGSNGFMDVSFSNGQVTQIINIEYLIFNDGHSVKT